MKFPILGRLWDVSMGKCSICQKWLSIAGTKSHFFWWWSALRWIFLSTAPEVINLRYAIIDIRIQGRSVGRSENLGGWGINVVGRICPGFNGLNWSVKIWGGGSAPPFIPPLGANSPGYDIGVGSLVTDLLRSPWSTLGCQINEYTRLLGTKETWRKKHKLRQTKVFSKNPPYSLIWSYSFNWHLRVCTLKTLLTFFYLLTYFHFW